MFDLKYCNWNKDMLMGVLPNSQFGDVAVIDIPNSGASDVVLGPDNKKSKVGVASKFGQSKQSTSQIQQIMDKMSDNDLLATVRSRHVQAPSEIIAWSKELSAYAEKLESRAQELIDAETAKQKAEKADAASADAASSE
jgi:predicted RND superfamily exporter protein